ncbi:MAG: hypothetical protein QOI70_274 [Microbacteriaceae bacterium]|nr:hypothetical protein [Microbacteriaceae bacterium]
MPIYAGGVSDATTKRRPGHPALVDPAVARITRLTAIDTVRARIALAISLGLMAAGDRLPSERELAHALAVSQITARRALVSLTEEGILTRRPGRGGGTFVAQSPPVRLPLTESYLADGDEVHALIDRRVLLEIAVSHYAALTATDADLTAMRAAIELMSTAADWAAYHAADEQFHLAVAAASALEFAQAPYASALTDLYRYFLPYPIAYLHGVNDDHAALVEAITRRDPAAAAEIARQHVSALHLSMFPSLAPAE